MTISECDAKDVHKTGIHCQKKYFGGMSDSDSLLEEDVHTPHPATEPTINN